MARTRISTPLHVAGISLVLILAACSSTGSSPSAAEPTPTAVPPSASSSAMASEPATGEATVLVAESDLGQILTDADGNTIYYFANDSEGVSTCTDDCLANWPPVGASGAPTAGDGVSAELGTLARDDGTTQLTVNGFPAYYFSGDQAVGDTNGQGKFEIWWVFGADGEPIEQM